MLSFAGPVLALSAASVSAVQTLFVRLSTHEGRMQETMAVVLLVNVLVLLPSASVLYYPTYELTPRALGAFVAAGLVGTLVARGCYFEGIKRVGASRAAPVKASQPAYAAVLALFVLNESPTTERLVGVVLIVLGIALVTRTNLRDDRRSPGSADSRYLVFPLISAFFYGVEPIFATIGFHTGTPVLVALAVKTLAASTGFFAYYVWRTGLPSVGIPQGGNGHYYLLAGIANTGFLFLYYSALEVATVSLVVPIVQMSPLFVVLLSFLFLRRLERISPALVAATCVVVAGAMLVTLFN